METVVTILGYNLTYLELIGSVFNFVSVLYAMKANWINWIASIICQVCFFFLFWNNSLYANAILQMYFTYICIVAIYYWKKTDKNEGHGLRWMKNKQRIIWSIISISVIFITYFVIKHIIPIEKQSANLFLDITVTVLSILGVNLLSFKFIESWIVWIITDIVCVFLFGFSGIYLVTIESLIFTGMATYGLFNWIKIHNIKTNLI